MNGVYHVFLSLCEFSAVSFQCSRPDLDSLKQIFCRICGVRCFHAGLPEVQVAASHCGGKVMEAAVEVVGLETVAGRRGMKCRCLQTV